METARDRRKYFFYRSDRINFCAKIMHRNFPPPNLCNLRPPLTIMLDRGWLPILAAEVWGANYYSLRKCERFPSLVKCFDSVTIIQ